MRNIKYLPIVYNNGIYGLKSSMRTKIEEKTMEVINRKRSFRRSREYTKTELIIKLSLIISILSLVMVLCLS